MWAMIGRVGALFMRLIGVNRRCVLVIFLASLLGACGGGSSAGITNNDTSRSVTSSAARSSVVSSQEITSSIASSSPAVSSIANVTSMSSVVSSASSFSHSSESTSIGVTSSLPASITLNGKITYDFVPHKSNGNGLDYAALSARAGRGLVVELLDINDVIIATDISANDGSYSFEVAYNAVVKVRVKAQILNREVPTWDFKVTDNTNNNRLYAMAGTALAVTEATAVRNLHAASGWTGDAYGNSRVAAPFAILDSVLVGVERVVEAGNTRAFPPLELRWSSANNTADGELELGEIATSFYGGDAIYILGSEDDDTDEYDPHVILHEWGHYLEAEFSRSDSIGGDHTSSDKLDMRVAMSEGFANAFSAMMLDDPVYRDTSGATQNDGFQINVNRINNPTRGWYSEASVQSVLYNFYVSDLNKVARDFSGIFTVFTNPDYLFNDALISIYVFAEQLRASFPAQAANFNDLLLGQNIEITNRFGEAESNSGGYAAALPIYKMLPLDNSQINVCSSNVVGAYNKIGVAQFLLINVTSPGNYTISAQEASPDSGLSDPDFYLYRRGNLLALAESSRVDDESFTHNLLSGLYVLELVDARVVDAETLGEITACFSVSALRVN